MILGELIKTYRTEHHMSMDDFAKKCGLSKAYISILERNINPVMEKARFRHSKPSRVFRVQWALILTT